jgi:hypothetical protein
MNEIGGDSMSEVYRNVGQLFTDERFAEITESPEWTAERIEDVRLQLEELLEKREPMIEEAEEGWTELETQYHWVSYVFRALGMTYSVAEIMPNHDPAQAVRPDFTLFYSADEFRAALPHRGSREYFAQVLATARVLPWDASLDEFPDVTEGPANPAFEVDKLIRGTGVNWGVLTNGRTWRLYHRETSGLFSTFYEVDLVAALQSANLDEFKYFWAIFSPEGLGGFDSNDPLVFRLLH